MRTRYSDSCVFVAGWGPPSLRRAFTLVELLVTIAMIAMLTSIMLPGIQAARESGRIAECKYNLCRLSIGLQEFDLAKGHFPSGVQDDTDLPLKFVKERQHRGWLIEMLPYLDERAVYKLVQNGSVYDAANGVPYEHRLVGLTCPSQPESEPLNGSNYAACHHDFEAPIASDNHGVFFLNSRIRADEISDGMGHTIFLGEKTLAPDDLSWMSGTRATLRNTGSPLNFGGSPMGEYMVGGFSSHHPTGVTVLFGDGHVQFLSLGIDTELLSRLGHRMDGRLLTTMSYRE